MDYRSGRFRGLRICSAWSIRENIGGRIRKEENQQHIDRIDWITPD